MRKGGRCRGVVSRRVISREKCEEVHIGIFVYSRFIIRSSG